MTQEFVLVVGEVMSIQRIRAILQLDQPVNLGGGSFEVQFEAFMYMKTV